MVDLDVLPQALLFALVIIGLYFTVRSVMKPPLREGATGSRTKTDADKDEPITTQITKTADLYESFIKKVASTENLQLAALKDAKDAISKGGKYFALTAFSDKDGSAAFDNAAKVVAMRQVIDQALEDAQGGGGGGGGGGQGGNRGGGGSNDDGGGWT